MIRVACRYTAAAAKDVWYDAWFTVDVISGAVVLILRAGQRRRD